MSLAIRCDAQVVQLPTLQNFSYSGSVLVPDRGSVHLGSVNRARSSSTERGFGPFRSRGIGQEYGTSMASAHVHIIDLREMDRQLLGGTPEQFMRRQRQSESSCTAVAASEKPKAKDPVESAKQLVRDARKATTKGNMRAADYYYRTAIRTLPKDLAVIAQAEYQRFLLLQFPSANPALAKN